TAEMTGMLLAHSGVAVFLAGALLVEALSVQREVALAPGQQLDIGGYQLRFDDLDQRQGPNYVADRAHLTLLRGSRELGVLVPEKRRYASGGQVMTEAGIRPRLSGDIYIALGEPLGAGAWAVRAHVKPFVRLIWLGALLMALGGLVTASDRRFRRLPENP
ncbi:MAG TPA: cytochrome c-type biogenesis CcmF C-terminal domain-containing protein, partial [Stenotrophomonas sp.]|nr:cytochrome c-type biogenesis CcmF C-terminal domain-containing protein [Stenotrophomonas sp.]